MVMYTDINELSHCWFTFPVMTICLFSPKLLSEPKLWAGPLTHWGRDKMAAIFQTSFSNRFSWMKMYQFRLIFHWTLFLRVQLTNIPALVQIMAWRRPGDKPLSEPMLVRLPTHICVTRPQWVNFFIATTRGVWIIPSFYIPRIRRIGDVMVLRRSRPPPAMVLTQ